MDFRLDSWQSDYAFPYEVGEQADEGPDLDQVDVTVEAPAHDWAAIRPSADTAPFDVVRFVDGVQASDAVIWIHDDGRAEPFPGLVASWGAGVITSYRDHVELERVVIERGVFSDARSLGPIMAGNLTWRPRPPDTTGGEGLSEPAGDPGALRERLGAARRRLEDAVGQVTPGSEDGLTVYDGLLHASSAPLTAVGLAKRAHRIYLPVALRPLQRHLARGERTPLFSTDPQRRKLSFYLALSDPLPPAVAEPGSCVARMELRIGPDTTVGDAAAFADRVAATIPRYASEPHVDPRAPQNLMPIRSLENELRRRLGRPAVLRPLLAGQAAAGRAAARV
ncbi:hypothetical protein [Euzebya tangerina]|uniref:hypothetical protein n=1 Tax=Euzebya tangerina TaxID=591198 RepID=UPI000E31B2A5|nr:hypothetical protein [Euzebya tangerina]